MKFSESMSRKANIDVNELNWPRAFYDEMDAGIRTEMLEQALTKGLAPENDAARKKLLDRRYGKKEKSGMMPDKYMELVLECLFRANQNIKSIKSTKKMEETLAELGMTEAAAGTEAEKETLKEEIRHALRLYKEICKQDRHYSSIIFGLGHMSEEAVAAKIKNDFEKIACGLDALGEENPVVKIWKETALDLNR